MADEPLFDAKQINIPFTIGIIKPDIVLESEKLSQIISFIENSNLLTIKNMFQRELMREEIINLFYKHESKPYFEDILKYMSSGECCVMVLVNAQNSEGEPIQKWKKMIGLMNPEEAKKANPQSLRGKHGKSIIKNEFHGSDNLIEANKERKIFQFKVPQQPPPFTDDPYKINFQSIKQFLHPPNLEHSSINQRMDLLALYGPIVNWHSIQQCFCVNCKPIVRECTQKKKNKEKLRILKILKEGDIRQVYEDLCEKCRLHCDGYTHLAGGREQQHILTDTEINELAKQVNKREMLEMLTIQKGSTAKIMIETIEIKEPKEITYNMDFFELLIREIQPDYYQRYDYTELQNLILQDRRIRIAYWVAKITGKSVDRFPPVTTLDNTLTPKQLSDPKSPFYTLNRKLPLPILIKTQQIKNVSLLFPPSIVDKKKLYKMEENLVIEKLLHKNLTKVTQVGEKGKGIRQAVTLLRPYHEGRHGDWENYQNLKGNSIKGQVGGKNQSNYMKSGQK